MRIALGSDHGGFELKEAIKGKLSEKGMDFKDFGTLNSDSVDYPDFAEKVAEAVASGEFDQGILCCGTGIGISIAANKIPGIRAALCGDCFSARMAREHNNANILCMGGRVIGIGLALEIVETWLEAGFQGGRHQRRVDKIAALEGKYHPRCNCEP
ncbi:MAG: Ribose 5-phosphate isomerase B [Firmicutes bacterium]|nr:Ribose 5-phosphate isomerase B [Bacillota bacterium]MDI6706076.1 ribose 5-phosphate isomerase B [Bacillota bacterium]